ncbi:hypothetical protein A2Z33_06295 [Candidatus Gottesmanbacteria bacterium RBG_16_52_11]|uniref:histidine kinase n=1 Tax=Candidatus Gottesmanbacteria bacterium RBG_16_52_11 TaxID=1798374 RepID=A0A1F5YXR4_9BACT|nr:MAG: hypothetical protein A2Z33_06295 [Candidatus Gottesmanbacteria bacterium RBG_16_52_11]
MDELLRFINPVARLGKKNYSLSFPILGTVAAYSLTEFFANYIFSDPDHTGSLVIIVSLALTIYFAFRDGVRGGYISAGIAVGYYFFIIYSRGYTGAQLRTGIQTTIVLGLLYFFLAAIIGWLKQTIDILIDREAEEKIRLLTIVQQLPVGIIITDRLQRIAITNRLAEVMLGMKIPPGEQLTRNGVKDDPDHDPAVDARAFLSALRTRSSQSEIVLNRQGGKKLYLHIRKADVKNADGSTVATSVILSDLTQVREEEVRKDDFINMASHELRTPVTSMKLYLDVMRILIKSRGDAKLTKAMHNIDMQTSRMQRLINDLLDVSRMRTGKFPIVRESFSLNAMVKATVKELQKTVPQRIRYESQSQADVRADRFRIYQVIANFITNAAKYSPKNRDITVRVSRNGGTGTVSVTDRGVGISSDQQKRIFERLYQVPDTKFDKRQSGMGLGLYISREIIRRHNGRIRVKSITGRGSTFSFSLPLT